MLTRLGTVPAVLMTLMVAACGGAPPPTTPTSPAPLAEPTVAARWVADDGSVVALNLVVPGGTDPRRARMLAERARADHPDARVLVRVFAATAGPERFDLGHVPSGAEPLVDASHAPSVIGVYDFPRRNLVPPGSPTPSSPSA